jgi:hypothetical protein
MELFICAPSGCTVRRGVSRVISDQARASVEVEVVVTFHMIIPSPNNSTSSVAA